MLANTLHYRDRDHIRASVDGKSNVAKSNEVLQLDSKENWYTYLSGGEKKKIIIVSAILKKTGYFDLG